MAADAFSTASEGAHQRAEQGEGVQAGAGVDAAANYTQAHGSVNSTGIAPPNLAPRPAYRPDSWIPIEEHVLHKPQRKVKMISIGCGFSGRKASLRRRFGLIPDFSRSDHGT